MVMNRNRATGPKNGRLKEVLFELRRVGKIMRVTAIDPVTGTEVISIADPRQGVAAIKRLAARKLEYVLEKNRKKQD